MVIQFHIAVGGKMPINRWSRTTTQKVVLVKLIKYSIDKLDYIIDSPFFETNQGIKNIIIEAQALLIKSKKEIKRI